MKVTYGDIFIEKGNFYITNFNTQKILDIRNNSLSLLYEKQNKN